MHPSAFLNCQKFVAKYVVDAAWGHDGPPTVLEFGSYDVNGTLKPLFGGMTYTGLDMSAGPNVDVVCDGARTPFADGAMDVIVSSSMFEHDACFWMTFLEMCRVLAPGGVMYINAPSTGPHHGYPGDCWRFYRDSWAALATWAEKNGFAVSLLESYIDTTDYGGVQKVWNDSVGVFRKAAAVPPTFKVVSARWGSAAVTFDVTDVIAAAIRRAADPSNKAVVASGRVSLVASNELAGGKDPAYGVAKTLTVVTARRDAATGGWVECRASAMEGAQLEVRFA